ncbi:integrase [Lysinibacillus parviboronicapiens]|uniref:integrase n=1 Tax=Lysinibacillus parviboronicapiens TaxID=436516 RepID=UPI000D3B9F01|nr:integrase [Lysinibacillus parviboronicapiens]
MKKYTVDCIYDLILSVLSDVGMNLTLKQDNSGINMSYNFIGDYVSFDSKRLIEAHKEILLPLPLEVYIKTITLHELGHAIDRQALQESLIRTLEIYEMKKQYSFKEIYNNDRLLTMILEEHIMNIKFEETAWDNAEQLNKEVHLVDMNEFEVIKAHSLSTYRKLYQEDLNLYNELFNHKVLQLA